MKIDASTTDTRNFVKGIEDSSMSELPSYGYVTESSLILPGWRLASDYPGLLILGILRGVVLALSKVIILPSG
jgi:hypothetical protein